MPTEPGRFACDACGKTYRWTPQLAGKRVKCKCGGVLRVPAEDPAAVAAAPIADPDPFAESPAAPEGFDDFAPAPTNAPPAVNLPRPAPAARPTSAAAARSQPTPSPADASAGKKKASDQWWYTAGLGVVMIPLAVYEYSRLSNLESADGPASIRVTHVEWLLYKTVGKVGVLVGFVILALALVAFGVHQFLKERRARG